MTSLTLSQRDRTILAIVVGIAGLLCIALLPFVVVRAMDAVLKGVAIKIPASGNPLIATAPRIVLAFFPVWGGLSVAAGAALLLVSRAIQRGESWARPAAIGLLAVPSITGAYFSGPVMFFGKNAAPLFVLIALIGLVPYFVVLLWGKAPAGEKLGAFFLFLMLGVSAAWSFSNGGSSLRMFWARPEPYMLDSGNYGFLMGIPVVWIGVIATVISIPLLAAHTRQGWRLAMVGIANILIGNSILFVTHLKTKEFLIGMIMGVVTLILLSIPAIGGRLGKVEEAAQGGLSA
jgi:hypothetical protein